MNSFGSLLKSSRTKQQANMLAADAATADGTKDCWRCGETKPLSEFGALKRGERLCYTSQCKKCLNDTAKVRKSEKKQQRPVSYTVQSDKIVKRIARNKIKPTDLDAICKLIESVLSLYGCNIIKDTLFITAADGINDFAVKINGRRHVFLDAALSSVVDGVKECPRCGRVKDVNAFRKMRMKNNGEVPRGRICKECIAIQEKVRRQRNTCKERNRASSRKYYWQNVEKIRAKRRVAKQAIT